MTPDQEAMLRMSQESLDAAQLLLERGYPAFASSRAYYSMFGAAEALLLSKELSFSKHSAVIAAFGQHFAKPGLVPAELHRAVLIAQKHRQAADYAGKQTVTGEQAAEDVRQARVLLTYARTLLSR
jgi:uncharacterized protein (UPF0332 family)